MSNEIPVTFEKLQELKDLKKRCEENLKGEGNVIKAEAELKSLEPIILAQIKTLQALQVEKEKHTAIASGRGGIDNCKIILKALATDIPKMEKKLKDTPK